MGGNEEGGGNSFAVKPVLTVGVAKHDNVQKKQPTVEISAPSKINYEQNHLKE